MGDFIINGGSLTDHENLATSILFSEYKTINISSGSWGPENAIKYWQENSDINIKKLIMVFSSHDYYDYITGINVVGTLNYPKKRPSLAITDGFYNYFIPMLNSRLTSSDNLEKLNKSNADLTLSSGWIEMIDYAQQKNIPLHVILHPDKQEVLSGNYNYFGRGIISFFKRE
ncbi:hypothetical protein [Vibrio sp. 10N.261.51.C6]|uniref:hypothetical protein n=1 Tax=Vibrio sp. 10N.261.51.C6 TaxID=3229676 RepID=UPI00354B43D1